MIYKYFFLIFVVLSLKSLAQSHRDSVDVCHYRLNIDMTQMGSYTISGCAQLKLKMLYPAVSIPLDLYKLTVDSIFIDDSLVSFTQNDTLLRINYVITNADTIASMVYYHGKPKKDSRWGGFYFNDSYAYNINVGMTSYPHGVGRFWYPCIDNFTDRATYDLIVTTHPSHKAICGGTLTNVSMGVANSVWQWQLHEAIPTYLASIAVGPFTSFEGVYHGISKEIPYNIYVSADDSIGATKTFAKLNQTMAAFEKYFGPYLWERIGYVVVPFESGAMEHATNIAFPNNALSGSKDNQILAAHELSHSWFGNLVTCSTSQDMWLNEGWASFCESVFLEEVYSKDEALKYIIDNHFNVLFSTYQSDEGYFALNQLPPSITYGAHAYNKGADVVNTLRNYLGDSLFFKGVRTYLNQKQFSSVSSYELRDILSQATGVDLEPFFETWVFRPGFPHYSIDSFTVENLEPNCQVKLYMRQKSKARKYFGNKNRVPVRFVDKNLNQIDTVIEFNGEKETIKIQIPMLPSIALVDVKHQVGDATTDDFHEITTTGNTEFEDCSFTLNTYAIESKAIVWVQNNWIPADTLDSTYKGLVMSNFNYWKVDGIFTDRFDAKGKFAYMFTTCSNPDIDYTPSSIDTMVLLYRQNVSDQWQVVIKGTNARYSYGNFTVNHVQPGEYAIAYWDGITPIGISQQKALENACIYPNPSKGSFKISLPEKSSGNYCVVDINGNQIKYGKFINTDSIYIKLTDSVMAGVYYLKIKGTFQSNFKIIKL